MFNFSLNPGCLDGSLVLDPNLTSEFLKSSNDFYAFIPDSSFGAISSWCVFYCLNSSAFREEHYTHSRTFKSDNSNAMTTGMTRFGERSFAGVNVESFDKKLYILQKVSHPFNVSV